MIHIVCLIPRIICISVSIKVNPFQLGLFLKHSSLKVALPEINLAVTSESTITLIASIRPTLEWIAVAKVSLGIDNYLAVRTEAFCSLPIVRYSTRFYI